MTTGRNGTGSLALRPFEVAANPARILQHVLPFYKASLPLHSLQCRTHHTVEVQGR